MWFVFSVYIRIINNIHSPPTVGDYVIKIRLVRGVCVYLRVAIRSNSDYFVKGLESNKVY